MEKRLFDEPITKLPLTFFEDQYELRQQIARFAEDKALSGLTFRMPLPPFNSAKQDAEWWSKRATLCELEAYAVHCFLRFSKARRQDFVDYTTKVISNV